MSKLDNLTQYYNYTRRGGHTTLMMRGITFDRPAVILFDTQRTARIMFDEYKLFYPKERWNLSLLKLGHIQFKSISYLTGLPERLRGTLMSEWTPIIVDHFAMQILIDEDRREKEKKQ